MIFAAASTFSVLAIVSSGSKSYLRREVIHVLAIVSSGSKSYLRREVIQLYRISRRELEKKLSTACSAYFVVKGGDSGIEIRDAG